MQVLPTKNLQDGVYYIFRFYGGGTSFNLFVTNIANATTYDLKLTSGYTDANGEFVPCGEVAYGKRMRQDGSSDHADKITYKFKIMKLSETFT